MDQRSGEAQPIRVVLADDHTLVREGTRRILEATSTVSVVAEAADGQQAVEVVDRFEPDVAIVDIGHHGPADDRRFAYEATWILRGLTNLHIEFEVAP